MTARKFSLYALGGLALVGCNDAPPAPPASELTTVAKVQPALPTAATPTSEVKPASQPVPAPIEPAVKIPDDLGGKAVQKSLMPTVAMPADLAGPKVPRPRTTPLDRGELPTPPLVIALRSTPNPKAKPTKPSPPPERAPADLGQAAAENLTGVKFVEKPLVRAEGPVNAGAADVPALARQLAERAPVDDPTAEISAAKLIATVFPFPVGTLPFLKQSIPDPFEFAEQLKGKLPRELEFGTVPSVVVPEKK